MRTSFWIIVSLLTSRLVAAADAGATIDAVTPPESVAGFNWSEYLQPPRTDANSEERNGFALLSEAMKNESYSEAEIAAKRIVEEAIAEEKNSDVRARALHNLAVTQQALGHYDAAKQNYIASADVISRDQNNLSPDLILPLRGLAAALLDTEQAGEAFSVLQRALHVSNVNYGPHSLEQLPILNTRMQYHLQQGDAESVVDVLDHVYLLYTRKYARLSEELLPALYQKAEVLGQLKHYGEERRTWRHILSIKQKYHARTDLELIEPHIRLAANIVRDMRKDSFRAVSSSTAEKHLKNALRIARSNPDAEWQVQLECILSLADFYTLFDVKARARRYYSEAWALLSSSESLLAERAKNLEAPVPIVRRPPDPYANFEYRSDRNKANPDDYLKGVIALNFTVDDRGRTRNVRIVEADPPGFVHMERRVQNAVEQFIYRPRFDDGTPVATGDQQYRARYYYRPSDYRASLKKTAARNRSRTSKQTEE